MLISLYLAEYKYVKIRFKKFPQTDKPTHKHFSNLLESVKNEVIKKKIVIIKNAYFKSIKWETFEHTKKWHQNSLGMKHDFSMNEQ